MLVSMVCGLKIAIWRAFQRCVLALCKEFLKPLRDLFRLVVVQVVATVVDDNFLYVGKARHAFLVIDRRQ